MKRLLEQANNGENITFKNVEEQFSHNNSFSGKNLRVSMDKGKGDDNESVEYLMEKLRQKGKKIKVIGEEDESEELEREQNG